MDGVFGAAPLSEEHVAAGDQDLVQLDGVALQPLVQHGKLRVRLGIDQMGPILELNLHNGTETVVH